MTYVTNWAQLSLFVLVELATYVRLQNWGWPRPKSLYHLNQVQQVTLARTQGRRKYTSSG